MGSEISSEYGPHNPSDSAGWSTLSGGFTEEFTGRERGVVESTVRDVISTTPLGSTVNVVLDAGECYGNIKAMGYNAMVDNFKDCGLSDEDAKRAAYEATDIY
ncbi:Hypothetical protein ORPV_38 [Orpheovirus IHUMI-LCC2]|uniref:Uncharacterized protein n=1 Tax=Orpheovirus IHUMI-LCC2 TaxID=2023057 RepID=A0A2I2L330_9VIRU|nr:Hypothetical protein ORPV_38 [Orpheovirus IHUMI-LCC2]SNW61942.1 Hypothetical protein ORPV_38 [Orpheovirus IHUMI-LCC2]